MKIKKEVPLIGKLAVKHGFISKDQLKRVLQICEESGKDGKPLGLPEVLVRTRTLSAQKMKSLYEISAEYEKKTGIPGTKETGGPVIQISGDGLKAELLIPKGVSGKPTIDEIMKMVKEQGIVHGLVKTYEIDNYLNNSDNYGTPIVIARGTPVFKGEPATLTCHFDSSVYRQVKKIDAETRKSMAVEEGDLLGEKKAMVPADSGVTVKGETIPAEPVDDIILRAGDGTELFEKEMKIVAGENGHPFIAVEGPVSVYDLIQINGDYGAVSGRVDRDCSLDITGILTGEYPVKGGFIKAQEIRGATIDVLGDIDVEVGITGSVVRCQGNVRARYIHGSVIETFGNVIVETEVLDSTISASGKCLVRNSRIVASNVSSLKGIETKGVGTRTSVPCEISVGHDHVVEKTLGRIEALVQKNKELIKSISGRAEALREERIELDRQIKEKIDLHKQLKNAIKSTEKSAEVYAEKNDVRQLSDAKLTVAHLKQKNTDTVALVKVLSGNLNEITEELSRFPEEVRMLQEEIRSLRMDKESILKWENPVTRPPAIRVSGNIAAGTLITCGGATEETEKDVANVSISVKEEAETEAQLVFSKLVETEGADPAPVVSL